MSEKRKEKLMYSILKAFLEEKHCDVLIRRRFLKRRIYTAIGQGFIEVDLIASKDNFAWVIECKDFCTIEQFGFALGQLICYKYILETEPFLLKDVIGREVKTKYSIALLETDLYQLTDELLETFRKILNCNNLGFGLLKVNETTGEVKELIVPT